MVMIGILVVAYNSYRYISNIRVPSGILRSIPIMRSRYIFPYWKNTFPPFSKQRESILKRLAHLLELFHCHVDRNVEDEDGEPVNQPEGVVKSWKGKQVRKIRYKFVEFRFIIRKYSSFRKDPTEDYKISTRIKTIVSGFRLKSTVRWMRLKMKLDAVSLPVFAT